MIDFIVWTFVLGAVVSFYLNNKRQIDRKKEQVKDLFTPSPSDADSTGKQA